MTQNYFYSRTILSSVFEREYASVFRTIRVGILAQSEGVSWHEILWFSEDVRDKFGFKSWYHFF